MWLISGDGNDMSDGRGALVAHISLCAVVVVDTVDVGGVVGMVDVGGVRAFRFVMLVLDVR